MSHLRNTDTCPQAYNGEGQPQYSSNICPSFWIRTTCLRLGIDEEMCVSVCVFLVFRSIYCTFGNTSKE